MVFASTIVALGARASQAEAESCAAIIGRSIHGECIGENEKQPCFLPSVDPGSADFSRLRRKLTNEDAIDIDLYGLREGAMSPSVQLFDLPLAAVKSNDPARAAYLMVGVGGTLHCLKLISIHEEESHAFLGIPASDCEYWGVEDLVAFRAGNAIKLRFMQTSDLAPYETRVIELRVRPTKDSSTAKFAGYDIGLDETANDVCQKQPRLR